ncbi:hypothetical protein BLNAU_1583 [Blattamonas nauphoetae]|uniref:Uncharacterized protein n=1 Tax=Blattamonas nauphoetae TaxID=2049346 RepID=A0ABQ9YII0_9EUKA|nr:hypothetical protein BLNAU_1583 [Blattamonas nauphoetae]
MISLEATPPSSTDSTCPDCSPFLNWNECRLDSVREQAVVFRSLVATLKLQPELDISLETKAVKLLKLVGPRDCQSVDAFLYSFAGSADEPLTNFVQYFGVLISTPNQVITTTAMEILRNVLSNCSPEVRCLLVKADLIHQLIISLNPLSLSFTEAVNIHINVMKIITLALWFSTPNGLARLVIQDRNEQQAVHETVLQQVLIPSENLLRICPYYQPTMSFVLHTPIFLTITDCLTIFESDHKMWSYVNRIVDAQLEWNRKGGEVQQMWKTVNEMLRMEGFEDGIEEKLQNDQNAYVGEMIVDISIRWNDQLGMNVTRRG